MAATAPQRFPVVLCTDGEKTIINPRGKTRLEIKREPDGYVARLTSARGRKVFATAKPTRRIDHAILEGVRIAAVLGRIKLPPSCRPNMKMILTRRALVVGIGIKHPDDFIWWFEAIIKPYIGEGTIWYAKIGDFVNTRDEFHDPYEALVCAASMLMTMGRWR